MATVSVFPENPQPRRLYRAVAGERQAVGPTVGDAVNAVTDQLGDPEGTTLVIVQPMCPDRFFTEDQIRRLEELMRKWRAARDSGSALPPDEQAELEALVRAEFDGMVERTKALVGQTAP